jgi:parallel beta-helix repeat protein
MLCLLLLLICIPSHTTISMAMGLPVPPTGSATTPDDPENSALSPFHSVAADISASPYKYITERSIMSTDVSNTITVSSATELMAALAGAQGGETILLEAGNYGDLSLYDARDAFVKFASEVTIKSADPSNMASFDSMMLRGVENLTFDTVMFDYDAAPGASDREKPFLIRESDSIVIRNSVFDGDLAEGVSDTLDGYGTGHGLTVNTGSSNITVENNEFYNWMRAGVFSSSDNLVVSNNEVHSVRSDGFNFNAVTNVLIEANYMHDFRGNAGSGDHMDMIQFWTNGTTTPSTDIVIRANVLDSSDGSGTQSIFMRNEEVDTGRAGLEMFYQNILIEDNVIHNSHTHGITVGETAGLTVRNNTILHNRDSGDDGQVNVPTINLKDTSLDVLIAGNIVPRLGIESGFDRVVENNLVVQSDNPAGDHYVGDLFVNGLAGSLATLDDLRALPDGLIEQLAVGSSLTRFDTTPEDATGYITADAGNGMELLTHSLDASALFGPAGPLDLSGATVAWDFGDGNSGTGLTGNYTWQQAGTYNVTALVTLADGQTVSLAKTVAVQSPLAIHATFDNGAGDLSDITNDVVVGSEVTYEGDGDDLALRLNHDSVAYKRNAELVNNSEYTLQVDFKKDAGSEGAGGTLVYFSSSFVVNIAADGLNVMVGTDQGNTWLKPTGVGINDSDWHRLALTFSGDDGAAIVYLDGVEVGRVTGLDGAIQTGSSSHDLFLGNPFDGTSSFSGLIDNVQFWKGAMSADDIQALSSRADDGKFAPLVETETHGGTDWDGGGTEPVEDGGDTGEVIPLAIHANYDSGAEDLSDPSNAVTVGSEVTFEGEGGDNAVRLNQGKVTYARSDDLINNAEYTLQVDFKKDAGSEGAGGTLVYFSSSFVVNIAADGLNVMVGTDQGNTWLKPTGVGINDSDWHRLALTFSGDDGAAILYLDGVEMARLSGLEGAIQDGSIYHDLHLGNPFNPDSSFTGLIDNLQFWNGAMSAGQIEALAERDADGKFAPLDDGSTNDGSTATHSDPATAEDDGATESTDDGETEQLDETTEPVQEDTALDFSETEFDQVIIGTEDDDILNGGNGHDYIEGGGGDDVLRGKNGNDVLIGGDGNDQLFGGNGDDVLFGGMGTDILHGGRGKDTFVFTNIAESRPGQGRDSIEDFTQGEDKIDVSRIDAIAGGSNDAFVFIGTAAFTAAGQLRQFESGKGIIVEGDVTGDGKADFQIAVQTQVALTHEDFIL